MNLKFKVSNQLLDTGYLYPLLAETLQMHLAGKDLMCSPVAVWGRRTLAEGKWWYGVEKLPPTQREHGIRERLKKIVALYTAIKKHGYIGSEITVKFTGSGNLVVHDGFHRLCILRFLNQKVDVYCRVKEDFPLLQTLRELNGGENLYQPTEDPRTDGWHVWRSDCSSRFKVVSEGLMGQKVLDAGCETGYFCRGLAERGYTVTGVDVNPKRVAVARYLAATQNLQCHFEVGDWQDLIKKEFFDNVLLLSVLHHQALNAGAAQALQTLTCLSGRCRRVFIEFPLESEGVTWGKTQFRWSFNHQELAMMLASITDMHVLAVLETTQANRPLIVLEAKC